VYRYVTATVEGFVQQVAVNLLPHGYHFYVSGVLPDHKDPAALDAKLIERYGLNLSKWARARRKKQGCASVQYLRHSHFFVLIATAGQHPFYGKETTIRDLRQSPLQCFGYSIGCYQQSAGRWLPSVRIAPEHFRSLQAELSRMALQPSVEPLWNKIKALPFAPFAPVCAQVFALLRQVNQRRKRAGLPPVPTDCVRRRRKSRPVFTR
jgi:hypothetical protein